MKKPRAKRRSRATAKPKMDAWARAEAYGVNMKLLEERLRMTPTERIQANDRLLDMVDEFRAAAKSVIERAKRLRGRTTITA